ncbi:T9SS type A sorting domain-containing protein [uncultured Draconibacterium sp.]|uniref:T9SS type A sorting domain-containing protein n=1 Tax=uncultured Draconibacterium sp. TaxID=1573823 RepID=UPI00321681D4
MKTIFILFILTLSVNVNLFANIAPPQAYISEIYIDSLNNWYIELGFPEKPEDFLDSLFIETSSGTFKVLNYDSIIECSEGWFPYLLVLSKENIENSFTLNRSNDFVAIKSFLRNMELKDELIFGNRSSSNFNKLEYGCSISHVKDFNGHSGYYSLDNTPSIGRYNDINGVAGTIQGYLYNQNNEPIPNSVIRGFIGNLETDENGFFYGEVLSRTYKLDTFRIRENTTYKKYIYCRDTINIIPNSTIDKDLYLFSVENYNPYDEIVVTEFNLNVYPNPFDEYLRVIIDIPSATPVNNSLFSIYNSSGKFITSQKLTMNRTIITFTNEDFNNNGSGLYFYVLTIDGRRVDIKNNQIIKL